jgi:valyl-tRNA synthetase
VEGPGVKALLDLEGLVDMERERERLVNKAQKASVEAAKARGKLQNEGFVAKAPESVVAEERSRLATAESQLAEIKVQYRERVGGDLLLPKGKDA